MDAREEILRRLRGQARPAELPAPWRSRRDFEDLAGRFCEALVAAKGEARRAADLAGALACLDDILREVEVSTAVANDEPPLNEVDLAGRWPMVDWRIAGDNAEEFRAFCITADLGVSGAVAALAETGTVVVASGPGRSRLTPLLPPVHVALVPLACLTTDLFTWAATRQGSLPAAMTLISGPSKTADIEQTMAIGVHGPKRFIAILFG
ncbi:MAG: lactate utilization protein [Chloroflexi bacterium]|nr:lactate utilization protein [Chloroflexota bacterium]MCI0577018.1 lactate utilization protein [Chloroflexota bacterium]MCI0648826.1 lactate utilization protein [Chloroflexota bacterium]MCI0726328.1 lactate utilization protein [Chloroflexota bacterium]